jgi:hypothetical protein
MCCTAEIRDICDNEEGSAIDALTDIVEAMAMHFGDEATCIRDGTMRAAYFIKA